VVAPGAPVDGAFAAEAVPSVTVVGDVALPVVVVGLAVVVVEAEVPPVTARAAVVEVVGGLAVGVGWVVTVAGACVVVVVGAAVVGVVAVPETTRVVLCPRWRWGLQYRT
jgi:hypothetical protein